MSHAIVILKDNIKPVKHSVRFDTDDKEHAIVNGLYVNRKLAKKLLGVKGDLEDVEGIEVTVRILKGKSKHDEDDD